MQDGIPIVDVCGGAGRVCLGTDCNARICFAEEMRWLEYSQRTAQQRRGVFLGPEQAQSKDKEGKSSSSSDSSSSDEAMVQLANSLFATATFAGARSLGLAGDAGVIAAGRFAD